MDLHAHFAARRRAELMPPPEVWSPRSAGECIGSCGTPSSVRRAPREYYISSLSSLYTLLPRLLLCLYAMRSARSYPRHTVEAGAVRVCVRTHASASPGRCRTRKHSSFFPCSASGPRPRRPTSARALRIHLYLYIAHGCARRSSRLRTGPYVRVK